MKSSFLKRQRTYVILLLAGLAVFTAYLFRPGSGFNAENYLPFRKYSSIQQDTDKELNLTFESFFNDGTPAFWKMWGYSFYTMRVDSVVNHSGKYALRIEYRGKNNSQQFGAPVRSIRAKYAGKSITLKAFMRTEGVDQPIGLMLRIDGNSGMLQFNNMLQEQIFGTEEWKEYSVTVPLPEEAEVIHFGPILSGKGKLWIDDVQLLIDNKDVIFANLKKEKVFPAESDTEFKNGSNISIREYTQQTVSNLELLGRIWGFLKYYHPAVAKGDYNWDAELFRVMPSIIEAANTDVRNDIFIKWIEHLGKFKPEKTQKEADENVKLKPDFTWMDNPELGKNLSQKLKEVKNAKRNLEHYYIGLNPGFSFFKNEKPYPEMKFAEDSGMRLLALFRYWNIIEYFFPYKYLIEKNWNTVLDEFIPVFLDGKNELEYKLALLRLFSEVNDTHANINGNDNELKHWKGSNIAQYALKIVEGIPYYNYPFRQDVIMEKYEISFVDGKAVVSGIEFNNLALKPLALKNGDVITHIDGETVEELVEKRKSYYSASNYSTLMRKIADDLLRTNNEELSLQIIREGKPVNCKITCSDPRYLGRRSDVKESFRLISNDTGYLFAGTLKNDSIPSIMEKIKDTKGIIIDFRCNSMIDNEIHMLSSLFASKPADYVKITLGSIEKPGMFTFLGPYKTGYNNDRCYRGKVVLIVNDLTQGIAEYNVLELQSIPQVKVIGSNSAGAFSQASNITIPGNVRTAISGTGFYYPDGREIQRAGIVLDMEVKPTIQGIIDGRDELLEKAIEVINQN